MVDVELGCAVGEEVEVGLDFAELMLHVVLPLAVAETGNLPAAVGVSIRAFTLGCLFTFWRNL